MLRIVDKCGELYNVVDTDDGVVESCSVCTLMQLWYSQVLVDGFSYDIASGLFHIEYDNSWYRETWLNRAEQHQITKKHQYFDMLDNYCFLAKNLYNHANFIHRQDYFAGNSYQHYQVLYKVLKADKQYPDYTSMPTHHTALQVLRRLDKNWKAYFSTLKRYNEDQSRFTAKPKPPKYLDKNGRFVLEIPPENIRNGIVDGHIRFNKHFGDFTVETRCYEQEGYDGISEVRIVPHGSFITIEVCYKVRTLVQVQTVQPKRVIGIDLGVDNFAAISNNCGLKPIILNGRGLKSINQFYNKRLAELKSKSGNKTTNRIRRLHRKRNNKVKDFMHKASRFIISYCLENEIDTIVIGWNDSIKTCLKMSKTSNQNFIYIPHAKFITMLRYKAEQSGIRFIKTEESYTSGTSFLDGELPVREFYNKSRRIHRGLFQCNSGKLVNADINASFQIIVKALGDEVFSQAEGIAVCPVRVNVA